MLKRDVMGMCYAQSTAVADVRHGDLRSGSATQMGNTDHCVSRQHVTDACSRDMMHDAWVARCCRSKLPLPS